MKGREKANYISNLLKVQSQNLKLKLKYHKISQQMDFGINAMCT